MRRLLVLFLASLMLLATAACGNDNGSAKADDFTSLSLSLVSKEVVVGMVTMDFLNSFNSLFLFLLSL